jgi:hypothetical protein
MRGYMLALAASIGVFMAGLSLGYLCIHLLSMSPKALLMAVMRTPSAQATVTRAEAVSQAVQAVAESMAKAVTTQPGRTSSMNGSWDTSQRPSEYSRQTCSRRWEPP